MKPLEQCCFSLNITMKSLIIKAFFGMMMIAVLACQSDQNGLKTSPNSGYKYKVYKSGNGEKIKEGEYAYFQFDIYDDRDSLLQSYRNQKQMPSLKVPPSTDPIRISNPVLDVIAMLSVGDSVGIIMPKDSLPNLPLGYEYVENFYYNITVKEKVDEATYKAKIEQQQQEEMAMMEELKKRLPETESIASQAVADYNAGKLNTLITDKGVKYFFHEKGTGDMPVEGTVVNMQYYGALASTGKSFDNSYVRGRALSFRIGDGSMIPGLDDATRNLPVGSKVSLFIPATLGYGEAGFPPDIPGGAELYFFVEVEEMFY